MPGRRGWLRRSGREGTLSNIRERSGEGDVLSFRGESGKQQEEEREKHSRKKRAILETQNYVCVTAVHPGPRRKRKWGRGVDGIIKATEEKNQGERRRIQ